MEEIKNKKDNKASRAFAITALVFSILALMSVTNVVFVFPLAASALTFAFLSKGSLERVQDSEAKVALWLSGISIVIATVMLTLMINTALSYINKIYKAFENFDHSVIEEMPFEDNYGSDFFQDFFFEY